MKKMIETKLNTMSPEDSLQAADFCMKSFSYRHLPVMDKGKLVGLISDRDVKTGIAMQSLSNKQFSVKDFMTSPAISVDRRSKLLDVVHLMLSNKIGSVIVTENDKISCIITETDLLRILQQLLFCQDKTVRKALDWNGISELDLVTTLSSLAYGWEAGNF